MSMFSSPEAKREAPKSESGNHPAVRRYERVREETVQDISFRRGLLREYLSAIDERVRSYKTNYPPPP